MRYEFFSNLGYNNYISFIKQQESGNIRYIFLVHQFHVDASDKINAQMWHTTFQPGLDSGLNILIWQAASKA